jgi:hypothetical protein
VSRSKLKELPEAKLLLCGIKSAKTALLATKEAARFPQPYFLAQIIGTILQVFQPKFSQILSDSERGKTLLQFLTHRIAASTLRD